MYGSHKAPETYELGKHFGGLRGPDPQDSRDYLFALNARHIKDVPEPDKVPDSYMIPDAWLPPVRDQGNLGSCVAWTYKGMREMLTLKVGNTLVSSTPAQDQQLSALWLYKQARERYHPEWANIDSGLYMRDGMGISVGRGIALEREWPYIIARAHDRPPSSTFAAALRYRNINAYRISTTFELRSCLAGGWPVAFGFPVFQSFYQAEATGIVPMPGSGELSLGGHANWFTGYKADPTAAGGRRYRTRNSWGHIFGDHGDLWFPEDFIKRPDILTDMWGFCLRIEPQFVDQPD